MAWLASLGHRIVGVEHCETAIRDFFSEQNIQFGVLEAEEFKIFTVNILSLPVFFFTKNFLN